MVPFVHKIKRKRDSEKNGKIPKMIFYEHLHSTGAGVRRPFEKISFVTLKTGASRALLDFQRASYFENVQDLNVRSINSGRLRRYLNISLCFLFSLLSVLNFR